MTILFKLIFFLVLLVLAGALYLTWHNNSSADEKAFQAGTIPHPGLSGFYKGSVGTLKTAWHGKKFALATSTGINVMDDGKGGEVDRYPFTYSEKSALREDGIKVIAIDYDLAENPWWVRPILDELVQVAPGRFLGKLNVRIIPGFPFTIGYFVLEK